MTLAREYVWGPGDWGGGGVDELLVQYDAGRRATWPILDSGGDVIALCDLGGANNSARVLTRIVYDAYGRVIGRSDPATPATGPPELRVGHKGLFFDRLDWGIVDPLTFEETPRLEPGARLIGYNRNRSVHVGWGRFLQRDPNATGLVVQDHLSYHGRQLSGWVQGFDLALHYGDGSNVYQYIGSDPLGGSDPAGLMEFSLGGLMGSSAQAAGMYSDYNQEVIQNAGIAYGFIGAAVGAYAMDQLLDGNWASDWNEPDDLYRGSAEWSSGTGSWASEGPQSVASNGQVVAGEYAGRFDKAERTANGLGVYIVKRGEEIIYVGRSRDLARRMKEQEARFGKGVKVVGLSFGEFAGRNKNNYKAVRALEDLLIRELRGENKDLANKINGMSDNDPKKRKAYQRALRAALGNLR